MKEWTRMPSYWVKDKEFLPLRDLKWSGPEKADNIAALMLFIVLNHHANAVITKAFQEAGLCALTYSELSAITGLSRSKVAGGLRILIVLGVISQVNEGRNNIYKINNYGTRGGWAKLPAKGLYSADLQRINAFHRFNLRSKNELNALKIYYLILTFRSNDTNYAQISYEKIVEYSGINRNEIKSALSLIISLGLIQVDTGDSAINFHSTVNMYRPNYLEPYKHRGTTARGSGDTIPGQGDVV